MNTTHSEKSRCLCAREKLYENIATLLSEVTNRVVVISCPSKLEFTNIYKSAASAQTLGASFVRSRARIRIRQYPCTCSVRDRYLRFRVIPDSAGGSVQSFDRTPFTNAPILSVVSFSVFPAKPTPAKIHVRCAINHAQPFAPGGHAVIRLRSPFPCAFETLFVRTRENEKRLADALPRIAAENRTLA